MRPYEFPALTKEDVSAIKALAAEQKHAHAINVIMEKFCDTYGLSYRPDHLGGARDSIFADGKRCVGLFIRKVITQPMNVLVPKEKQDAGSSSRGRKADQPGGKSAT